MLQRIRNILLTLGVFSFAAVPVALPVTAFAADNIGNQVCAGIDSATLGQDATLDPGGAGSTGCEEGGTNSSSVQRILTLVVNIFSIIVGFIAVIMIIYGGVKYITSGGESSNISSAKSTIIYAIIGLVIVALAQVIVRFVLAKASSVTGA